MPQPRQFSIKFLLVEILLLAVAMGLTRWVFLNLSAESQISIAELPVPRLSLHVVVAAGCFGTAIGGLFGRMRDGGLCAVVFAVFVIVPLWVRTW